MMSLTREATLLSIKVSQLGFLSLLLGGLVGCNQLASIAVPALYKTTPIANLQQHQGGTVYLEGKVGDRAPLLGSGAYQLQDASGQIWIVTSRRLPAVGDSVLIEGQVNYKRIPVGEQDLGELYVIEVQQLQFEPADELLPTDELFFPHKSQ